jgi:hypothetical protein
MGRMSSRTAIGALIAVGTVALAGAIATRSLTPGLVAAPAKPPTATGPAANHPGIGHGRDGFGGGVGTVTAIKGSSLTLRTLQGSLTVDTTASTTYTKEQQKVSFGDIHVGDVVRAKPAGTGTRPSPGATPKPAPTEITATSIEVVMPSFVGRVESVNGSTITIVDMRGKEKTVTTTSSTRYLDKGQAATSAIVKAGAFIRAEGSQSDLTHLTADVVSTGPPAAAGPAFGGGGQGHGPHGPKPGATPTP